MCEFAFFNPQWVRQLGGPPFVSWSLECHCTRNPDAPVCPFGPQLRALERPECPFWAPMRPMPD